MTNTTKQPLIEDQLAGMAWWNSLTPIARRFWLEAASWGRLQWDTSAADAWKAFKSNAASASTGCDRAK
jgi:hypothetical protein